MGPKPPDLDAQGNPVVEKPPDLPADYGHAKPDTLDYAASWIPTIGATLGGIAGAGAGFFGGTVPGSVAGGMAGSAAGGGLGKAIETGIRRYRHPEQGISLSDLKDIGAEGAVQGALYPLGAGIAKAASVVARPIMKAAIAPVATRLAEKFPGVNIPATMIAERIGVGQLPGTRLGSDVVAKRFRATPNVVQRAFGAVTGAIPERQAAEAAPAITGFSAPSRSLLGGVRQRITETANLPIGKPTAQKLGAMSRQFLREHPGSLSGPDLVKMQQAAQQTATSAYNAARAYKLPTVQTPKNIFNKEIAGAIKGKLEAASPAYAAAQKRIQALMPVQSAVRAAEGRAASYRPSVARVVGGLAGLGTGGYYGDYGSPQSIALTGLGYAAANPATLSRLALRLAWDPQYQFAVRAALGPGGPVSLSSLMPAR